MLVRLSVPLLLLAVVAGHAQSPAKTYETVAISPVRIQSLLEGMGIQSMMQSSGEMGSFAFFFNGHAVKLHSEGKSILLSACFQDHIEPIKANQWDRQHFSTRSSLDDQGCTALRSEIKFGGSYTNEEIVDFVREFLTDATIFGKFLNEAPFSPAASPVGPMEWSQFGQSTKRVPAWTDTAQPVPGVLKISRNISLKYDPDRWIQAAGSKDGQFALVHSSGGAHATVIAERVTVSRDSVEDIALANAQSADPQARIVFREQRRINGADVRCLRIEADVQTVPMLYRGCFYGGEYGTVQVVAYTAKDRFPEFEKDFEDLLKGFTVSK